MNMIIAIIPCNIPVRTSLNFLFCPAVTNQSTVSRQAATCHYEWLQYVISFLALWSVALVTEITIVIVSSRGTIFSDGPRKMAEFLLYVKLSGSFDIVCPTHSSVMFPLCLSSSVVNRDRVLHRLLRLAEGELHHRVPLPRIGLPQRHHG